MQESRQDVTQYFKSVEIFLLESVKKSNIYQKNNYTELLTRKYSQNSAKELMVFGMNGWMDGWIDQWIAVCMNGWMGGWKIG